MSYHRRSSLEKITINVISDLISRSLWVIGAVVLALGIPKLTSILTSSNTPVNITTDSTPPPILTEDAVINTTAPAANVSTVTPSHSSNNLLTGEASLDELHIIATLLAGSQEAALRFENMSTDWTFSVTLRSSEWIALQDNTGNQYEVDPFSVDGLLTILPGSFIDKQFLLTTPIDTSAHQITIYIRHVTSKRSGSVYADFHPDMILVAESDS